MQGELMLQKERFTIDTEKIKTMIFPKDYESFNQLCYDVVLFDNQPCSIQQRDKLAEKSVNQHIKKQLHKFTDYYYNTPEGKRGEQQFIYGLKDYHREVMRNKTSGKNVNYKSLTPLLKNLINNTYTQKGVGCHIIQIYNVLDYLNILGENYDNTEGLQNKYYSLMAIKSLDDNINSVVNRYIKSLNNSTEGISLYKGGTVKGSMLDRTLNYKYEQIREKEKEKIKQNTKDYRHLNYNVSVSLNEELAAANQNWKPQKFYYNWILTIQPSFKPFIITEDLHECRKDLNKNFLLKLKNQVGYDVLTDFLHSYDFELIRNQIERDADADEDFNLYVKILSGVYIPNDLKQYLYMGKGEQYNEYHDIYRLGSYLYDINAIIKNSVI
jgi:hypothetical protein